jgi:twinkle protein
MQSRESTSEFVEHTECPKCGSRDNAGVYDDGHTYCFGCQTYTHPQGQSSSSPKIKLVSAKKTKKQKDLLPQGKIQSIATRNLTEQTCKFFNYTVSELFAEEIQIANYVVDRQIVAQKIRNESKEFFSRGDIANAGLFGQHLFQQKGRMIIVTEGEIDCMSVSQIQNHKFPVVSVSMGSQSAAKVITKNLEYFSGFESVILMFDMDDSGQMAAKECAKLFKPGKAKIAALPLKDANEMLLANRGPEVLDAMWKAKEYRPDGIVNGAELWEEFIRQDDAESVPYPWDGLNEKTKGLRKKELTVFTAGSGIGKSAIVREIGYHLIQQDQTIGVIMLEESIRHTLRAFVGLHLNKRLTLDMDNIPESDLQSAFDDVVGANRLYLYDHFGSTSSDNLMDRIRYLHAMGCGYVILDHLSIVVSSGLSEGVTSALNNERVLIDSIMTRLRSLVEETGVGLILVSHLKRPEGKSHEEGAATSLAQLRGSGGIGHLADMVIGAERNQQSPDDVHKTRLRVLKNRYVGETGLACTLEYNTDTGRLLEVDPDAGDF